MDSARNWARWALTAALVFSALLLTARTLAGPFTSPIHIRSPLNLESAIGLAVLLLLLLGARFDAPSNPARRGPGILDMWAILLITGVVAAVFWQSTCFYFLSDDFVLLKQAGYISYSFRGIFGPGSDGAYRPVTHLFMRVVHTWAGSRPMAWHFTELALHTANSILVFATARMLAFSRFGATFAASLFAVHGTRPEAVVWIAGRADLLAAFFVLLGVICFISFWTRSGVTARLYYAVSLALMTAAILSKESAYTFPLLLVVFLASRNALRVRRGIYALIPFFAVTTVLLAWRIILLGGVGGYRTPSGAPEALSMSVASVVKALGLRLPAVLFFPINWSHEPGTIFGLVMILYLASLVWMSRARVSSKAFLVPLGFLLALALPPLSQLLIGADLQKARLLYLPLLGFCLLLATALEGLKLKSRWIATVIILAFNTITIFHNLGAWKEASQLASAACRRAAACTDRIAVVGLPVSRNGVYFFANGFPECVELERNKEAGAVDVRSVNQPIDRLQYDCVLSWDNKTGELSPVPYDIH